MIRFNCVNFNNYYPQKITFKGNKTQTNPQINELKDVNADYNVKTPISYTKTDEIDFPYGAKAYLYKLSNGQKVVIVPQEGETVLRTYVNTGSMNEPDKIRGISHYIEHNLFNGSKGLEQGDFFKQVDKMGASTNASTGFAETNYFISSNLLNENDLETKIKLHSSMLETPLFAIEKLEKEKGIVNSEINMITSDPQNLAINKMLKNLYGIQTTSTDMIGGTTDNINNLTRDDVVNYFNNNYYPANMVTVVTGEVNPEETMKLISKYFTSKKQPSQNRYFEKLNPIQNTVREDIISDKATGSYIVLGFNGPKTSDSKDRIFTEALSILLSNSPSSRIDKILKPLHASSFVEMEKISSNPQDSRALIFMSKTDEENSEKVLKVLFNEIGNIANNPPTEKEMKIIKKMLLKNFSTVFENSFASNNEIGTAILENNTQYVKDFENIVNSMTAEDLVNTAKKYLDINKASVTVVHPSSATEESINKNYKNVSFTGKQAINMQSVKQYNLQNNFRVITVNSKTDNVEIVFRLDTDEDVKSKPSASLILSRLLNEGSMNKKQEDFDSDLAQEGIYKGLSASESTVACTAGCDTTNISQTFDIIKEIIDNPRFTKDDFELARNKIINSLKTSSKSAYDKLDSELFKGLPEGYTKQEILKDLETVTLEDVKNLYSELLKNSKGIVSVCAPFDRKPELRNDVFNCVSKFQNVKKFETAKVPENYTPVTQTKVITDTDYKNQAEIIESFKFKTSQNIKDIASIKLLNIILGGNPSSRLFMDLRENEKLAYQVKSNYRKVDDIGVLNLKIKTTTENKDTGETSFDNVRKSIDGFNKHINKLKKEKVSEEELNNAKLYLKNMILNTTHSSDGKNESLIKTSNTPYGIGEINMFLDEIDKITTEDIYNTANYIFSNKPIYSILATENTLKANEDYFKDITLKL